MSNKFDATNFLKKELKELTQKRRATAIIEQSVFDEVSAGRVKVKSKNIKT